MADQSSGVRVQWRNVVLIVAIPLVIATILFAWGWRQLQEDQEREREAKEREQQLARANNYFESLVLIDPTIDTISTGVGGSGPPRYIASRPTLAEMEPVLGKPPAVGTTETEWKFASGDRTLKINASFGDDGRLFCLSKEIDSSNSSTYERACRSARMWALRSARR